MPELSQVFKLLRGSPTMLINIEMKGPRSPETGVHYNTGLVCEKVKALIEDFGISDRTIISSFRPEIANKMKMEPK